MEVVCERCCGLDVYQKEVVACAMTPEGKEIRRFGTHERRAQPDSGLTLVFEAFVMALVREMSVRATAQPVGEHDTRLWRILHHLLEAARGRQDLSEVRRIGIDETATRRGHRYVTFAVDLDQRRLIVATPDRDPAAVAAFAADLTAHGGNLQAVTNVTCDMSAGSIEGIRRWFLQAEDHLRPLPRHEAGPRSCGCRAPGCRCTVHGDNLPLEMAT